MILRMILAASLLLFCSGAAQAQMDNQQYYNQQYEQQRQAQYAEMNRLGYEQQQQQAQQAADDAYYQQQAQQQQSQAYYGQQAAPVRGSSQDSYLAFARNDLGGVSAGRAMSSAAAKVVAVSNCDTMNTGHKCDIVLETANGCGAVVLDVNFDTKAVIGHFAGVGESTDRAMGRAVLACYGKQTKEVHGCVPVSSYCSN